METVYTAIMEGFVRMDEQFSRLEGCICKLQGVRNRRAFLPSDPKCPAETMEDVDAIEVRLATDNDFRDRLVCYNSYNFFAIKPLLQIYCCVLY